MAEFIPFLMFLAVCLVLMAGYPVAFSLAGTALLFAIVGTVTGHFDMAFIQALPNRLFGTMENTTLIAVPLFILMGVMLEKSKLSEDLLESMADLFGEFRSGLGISVVLVGALLAASTGIVGATVVTMGLMSLPTMLKRGYSASQATGLIAATGTLGQIIPPSIALVLLGDTLSSAYQQAQLNMGIFTPKTISIGDLFVGALIPGLLLVIFYCVYLVLFSRPAEIDYEPQSAGRASLSRAMKNLLPPVFLIVTVLGSILTGIATPTEAAGVGAFGATALATIKGQLNFTKLREVALSTTQVTSMVFLILIGASVFSLVFRGFGGEEIVEHFFTNLPGGIIGATLLVMVVIFLLGFILDFIEITFVVVPIVAPVLLAMGLDPVWLGIMIAINLQTSFLTPPFGFALFYLRGVAPASVETSDMYRGVLPFIGLQLLLMVLLSIWPEIATWLPSKIYN
ncbi:MAG: tripartite ATP-independent transporter DctM subunit [Porticoccaceae bacterium]|jgi:tripartite ATP-independent transporter DctM subunit|tara:strand:- start:588 stop:1952 length:1365 start_codon:yes stop_codon:yes gene_type:complete